MNPRVVAIGIVSVVVVAIVAVVVWATMREADDGGTPNATAAPTVTAEAPGDGPNSVVTPPDREGVTLGEYDPLIIPDGVTGGGSELPESALTAPDTALTPGESVVTGPSNLSGPRPYLIIEIDEVSPVLSGGRLERAYKTVSFPQEMDRIVQRVELRVRAVAGEGELTGTNLAERVLPVNHRMQGMTVRPTGEAGCGTLSQPFAGIEEDDILSTTVKVCFYAFGTIDAPYSMLSNLELSSSYNYESIDLYVQSDIVRNPDFGELEDEDEWKPMEPAD